MLALGTAMDKTKILMAQGQGHLGQVLAGFSSDFGICPLVGEMAAFFSK